MSQVRATDFSDVRLYAVSNDFESESTFLSQVKAMLQGGVDAFQLRLKKTSDRDYLRLAFLVRDLCHQSNALFIVNNRPDMALLTKADGVHVGHEDLSIADIRSLVGHRLLVGASTHSLPEAIAAQKAGADYVSCGPLWPTPTKPDYKPVGLGLIGLYKAALNIPFVAIGAIDENNLDQVLQSGATTVALVRQLFNAPDAKATAQKFKEKITAFK